MGKLIVVENGCVESVQNSPINHVGLLIGQLGAQRNYVCFPVKTPSQSLETDSDQEVKSKKSASSLETLEDWWILEHTRQVIRALPGGLDVIGLYVVTPPASAKGLYPRLRQLLDKIYELQKSQSEHVDLVTPSHFHFILLQICPATFKTTCKTVDVSERGNSFVPAELKTQSHSDRWHCLHGNIQVQLLVPCSEFKRDIVKMQHAIKGGMKSLISSLKSSILVGKHGHLVYSSEVIKPETNKQKQGTAGVKTEVELFRTENTEEESDCCTMCTSATLKLQGMLSFRGYVPPKAVWEEGEKAVKVDILRSLMARCELLSQEVASEDQDKRATLTSLSQGLPRRSLITPPITIFPISDYTFDGETEQESIHRVVELISLEDATSLSTVEHLEDCYRPCSDEAEVLKEAIEAPAVKIQTKSDKTGLKFVGLVGAVAIATAASALWWLIDQNGL